MRREYAGALLVWVASLFAGSAGAADAGPDPRPGIVRLERAGSRLGFGMVLRSDGRILTALSALGHGNYLRARFSDEHVLAVHVVATDRAWDLALLASDGGYWASGLAASALDAVAEGESFRRFSGRGKQLSESAVVVRGQQTLLGRDGAILEDVVLLGTRMDPDELGSPILDERGEVVALVGQACDPGVRQDCRLTEELSDVIHRIALTTPGRASEGPRSEPPPEPKVRLLIYGSRKFREASLPLRAPLQLPVPSRAGAQEQSE